MIDGKKVRIEAFNTLEEVKHYIKLYNNLEYRSIHDHTEVNNGEVLFRRYLENGLLSPEFSIYKILNKENVLVGIISYSKLEDYDYVLGYRILKPQYKHKGYMSEALTLFVSYMFNEYPKLRRCTLKIASENIESIGLAKKVGFVHEGTLREGYEYRNHVCDFEIYSKLRKEMSST